MCVDNSSVLKIKLSLMATNVRSIKVIVSQCSWKCCIWKNLGLLFYLIVVNLKVLQNFLRQVEAYLKR